MTSQCGTTNMCPVQAGSHRTGLPVWMARDGSEELQHAYQCEGRQSSTASGFQKAFPRNGSESIRHESKPNVCALMAGCVQAYEPHLKWMVAHSELQAA